MAGPPQGQQCSTCRNWITTVPPLVIGPKEGEGVCNRYPPVPSNIGWTASDGAWAITKDTHWCGEWAGNPSP